MVNCVQNKGVSKQHVVETITMSSNSVVVSLIIWSQRVSFLVKVILTNVHVDVRMDPAYQFEQNSLLFSLFLDVRRKSILFVNSIPNMASIKICHGLGVFVKVDKDSLSVLFLDLHPLDGLGAGRERLDQRLLGLVQHALDVEGVAALPPLVGHFFGLALADGALAADAVALRVPEGALLLQIHFEDTEEL